ncbi:P-loop NTPase family protein [Neorhodopirellula pilleata]|uniref:Tyrosine-protein kinase ptk n=1 Tax=Neorhodopirellula pilleata TaxID=2714738 RepID=A0A5C6A901_9BACT|nr:hypothetical protein [Neorhodopirellula pilleata]TWT96472.1 Tyrosine-protein kinase ptk [Neorhodopirellula pilleata]
MASNRFASILTNVGWPTQRSGDPVGLIGLTGCHPGHGVSTISGKVAEAAAASQKRTLLVDFDFENPTLHRLLDLRLEPGLTDLINTDQDPNTLVQPTSDPHLCLLSAGNCDRPPTWNEESIRAIFRTMLVEYDLVVCDIPILGTQPHVESALASMDRVLLVVDYATTSSNQLTSRRRLMDRCGISVSGVVLNRVRSDSGDRGV